MDEFAGAPESVTLLGYGALLSRARVQELAGSGLLDFGVAWLRGWRREWGALYRNDCYECGRYLTASGKPYVGGVAFLSVHPVSPAARADWSAALGREPAEAAAAAPAGESDGEEASVRSLPRFPVSVVTVTRAALAAIDEEEYLYARVPIRRSLVGYEGVMTPELYVPLPERFPDGWYRGEAIVVSAAYHELVVSAEARLGVPASASEWSRIPPSPWPVSDLRWESR